MTTSLLLTNGYIHSVAEPYANALHADNGVVAWIGSDAAAEQMVAATASGPVTKHNIDSALVTPAFFDGLSSNPVTRTDTRVAISSTQPTQHGVYYAPLDANGIDGPALFVAGRQLGRLSEVLDAVKPPTQLLIESTDADQLETILVALGQQPNTALMRSRHRVLVNHDITADQIGRLVATHASVTVVPDIVDGTPKIHAPVATLIAQGVPVVTGTGGWSGSVWSILTALIEHDQPDQRVSTRAAFNTMTRDGMRVWPSRMAQTHMGAGQVGVGSPADLNVWRGGQLGVQAPDTKAAHWSTDKRAGTPLLPILSSTEPVPAAELRIRGGQPM